MSGRAPHGRADAITRRVLLASLGAAAWPVAAAPALPAAVHLPDEIAAARRAGQALVVMVSLHGCVYCRVVRDLHLAPLRARDGLQVVQVDMRSSAPVVDPEGRSITHDALVRAWRITLAPTVLFLGAGGRELAPRLQGMSSTDFYGAYLDERIETARRALRA